MRRSTLLRALALGLALSGGSPVPAHAAASPSASVPPASVSAFPHAHGRYARRPVVATPALVGPGGKPYSLLLERGKWLWLYFGFSNCPSVCPFTLDRLAREYKLLRAPEKVQPVFVSLDPERDAPEALALYTRYFHPAFKAATAPHEVLRALIRSVNASYAVGTPEKPGGDYWVAHPNTVFVVDPEGRLAATYEPRFDEADGALAEDFDALPPEAAEEADTALLLSGSGPRPDLRAPMWCGGELEPNGHALVAQDPLMARAATLGSGTSVLPADSPMRMWALRTRDWLLMIHGAADLGPDLQGGPRGALAWGAENWQKLHLSGELGPGLLDLRAMTSLEPFVQPAGGVPQLFQLGETYQFRPLVDRQHPHDLFMELSARYTWSLAERTALFLYAAPAGEPALGPGAYLHRPSAMDNPSTPLGHHLQDSTHTAYGVATVGARQGDFQLEGSLFNGREPDEFRTNLELAPLDSWAARLSWFPGRNWSLQLSHGYLREPERAYPGDVQRTSASVTHTGRIPWGQLSTSLIWGQSLEMHRVPFYTLQSYGLESDLIAPGRRQFYGRFELVDRVGLGGVLDTAIQRVGALTLGAVQEVGLFRENLDLGVGADLTVYTLNPELQAVYGSNPVSGRLYLRLRPPLQAR